MKAAEIQTTERAWLKYRDAWVNFTRVRYSSTPSDAWLSLLTSQRTERLTLVLCGFTSSDALCTEAIRDQLENQD